MLTESLSLPIVDKCIGVEYINNVLTFYQSEQCVKTIDKDQHNIKPENELQENLEQISKFVSNFNGSFSSYTRACKQNSSVLPGHYTFVMTLFFHKCSQVSEENSSALFGYHMIRTPNGSLISVYCDMKGGNCDGKGGWMRVGYLNMSELNALCSPGLYTCNFNSTGHPFCDRFNRSSGGCNSTFFSTHGISYQHRDLRKLKIYTFFKFLLTTVSLQ